MDDDSRAAARQALLVAVPAALLTFLAVFLLLGPLDSDEPDESAAPSPVATGPVPTGPVTMPVRELTERQETVCRALLSQLPAEVGGLARRPVTAGAEQNAAYGDPPVRLACGVPEVAVPPTAEVLSFVPDSADGGVCWYRAPGGEESVWTSLGREVPVEVRVPAGHDEPGQWVSAVSGTLAETVPPGGSAPAGCAPASFG